MTPYLPTDCFMTLIEKKSELMSALSASRRGVKDYHRIIRPVSESIYEFNIQIYDSPEVDIWWQGKFETLNGGIDVRIIEESTYRS